MGRRQGHRLLLPGGQLLMLLVLLLPTVSGWLLLRLLPGGQQLMLLVLLLRSLPRRVPASAAAGRAAAAISL